MPKEDLLELHGTNVELLPKPMFRVRLENDHEILGHTASSRAAPVRVARMTARPESPFRAQARTQAGWCVRLDSPFTARLCELFADRIDPATPLGRRLDQWPGDAFADLLALRLAGALHARVRSGRAPALARLYPPAPLPERDELWAALEPELGRRAILPWLDTAPQTNEVARSGVLVPGFLAIAAATGLPLSLLELGASAGLNLVPDRYRLKLGALEIGPAEAAVHLQPVWDGPDPPAAPLAIAARAGVDLNPLDVSNPTDRNRMLAYLWPDQPERLERMAAAIAATAQDPPELVAGDAADFTEARARPVQGVVTTLFHSIALQYFAGPVQARILQHMEGAGAAASARAPLAWLRFEMDDPAASDPPKLRLRLWPGGADRLLAVAHPHGARVRWLA